MKKLLLGLSALALCSGVFAKKVAFVVDMTGQTVSSNGVHVAGNFQGWSPSTTGLTNIPSTQLYAAVVEINAGQVIEYKFINGNDWPGAESVPALSQKGHANNGQTNDNRWAYIDSMANDTTVLQFAFSASAPIGKVAIRFAVDMQKETAVSAYGVHLAGSIQGWNPASTMMANLYNANKIYEVILTADTANYEYKFVNGNDWNSPSVPESVPSGCATNGNRAVAAFSNMSIAKVCFNSCTACPAAPLPTYNVTFRVDMSNTDCDGTIDSVTVAGGKIPGAWGDGTTMTATGNVYSVTLVMDSGEVEFKYRWHKNGNTNWESIPNRIRMIESDTVLPAHCFSTNAVCVPKPAPQDITFVVDLINETPKDTIWVMGSFTRPNWQAGAVAMTPVSGKPGLYSTVITGVCDGNFTYKFTNGDRNNVANEETFSDTTQRSCVEDNGLGGFNRKYTRTVATPVELNYVFNMCTPGRSLTTGIAKNTLNSSLRVYPNPTSTFTVIEFNDNAANHNITLVDLAGRTIRNYDNQTLNTLRIEKGDLKSGIYFINVNNNLGQTGSVKLLID